MTDETDHDHDETDQWPKTWNEITGRDPDSDGPQPIPYFREEWFSFGENNAARLYDGTFYINADAGIEGENGPQWYPLEVYLREVATDTDGRV